MILRRYRALRRRIEDVQNSGQEVPFFQPRDGVSHSVVRRNGKSLVSFSGYNYLGLNGHPAVTAAAKNAIDKYGTSASASRIVAGQIELHGELERKIANFLGTEDALGLHQRLSHKCQRDLPSSGPAGCGNLRFRRPQQHHHRRAPVRRQDLHLSQWRLGWSGCALGQGACRLPPRHDRGRRRLFHGRPDPGSETRRGNQEAP